MTTIPMQRTGSFRVAFALASAACASPQPVVRLTPRSPDVFWSAGLAVVTRAVEGIRVAAAFDHQAGPLVAFGLEV
jgi:hypothetical protein